MAVSEINHKSVPLFSFAARFCGLVFEPQALM